MKFIFIYCILGLFVLITLNTVYAQTQIALPQPTPNLQFQPQPAYIQIQNPNGVQQSGSGSIQDMLIPTIIALGGTIVAKIHSDKKTEAVKAEVNDTKAEVLVGKEVDKEIAKVAYAANPAEAAKIEGVPIIKNEALATDMTEYAAEVTKT